MTDEQLARLVEDFTAAGISNSLESIRCAIGPTVEMFGAIAKQLGDVMRDAFAVMSEKAIPFMALYRDVHNIQYHRYIRKCRRGGKRAQFTPYRFRRQWR